MARSQITQLWAHEMPEADLRPKPKFLGPNPNAITPKSRLSSFKHDVMTLCPHTFNALSRLTDKWTPFPAISSL